MEENENDNVFYDYVKMDTIYHDEINDKWYTVPTIIQLDDTVTNVYVSNRESKYSVITICMSDQDTDIDVETSKIGETFDIIFKSLKKISEGRYEDSKSNQID